MEKARDLGNRGLKEEARQAGEPESSPKNPHTDLAQGNKAESSQD